VADYAVVLLIDGPDAKQNERAFEQVRRAANEISNYLEYMPKPIDRGPSILRVSAEKARGERILLWSLGLQEQDLTQPHAAVLYGKARWIGPLLVGEEITLDTLARILFVVGADCECGLDPRMIRGAMLPINWASDTRAKVAANLGFDPDNPMVATEVSQILRMRTLLRPEFLQARQTRAEYDDLPVPYVEDLEARETKVLPGLTQLGFITGGVALLVVVVGLVVFVVTTRRG
jgi:hypothetical protein